MDGGTLGGRNQEVGKAMTKDEFIAWDMDDGLVSFQGEPYILVTSTGETDAAITTKNQYSLLNSNSGFSLKQILKKTLTIKHFMF